MLKVKGFVVILLFLILFQMLMFGCATTKKPSQAEIFNQFESISQLDKEIFRAKDLEMDSYSPQLFKKSQTLLDESIQFAKDGKNEQAISASQEGVKLIRRAEYNSEKAKKIMWEVSDYRIKTIKAGVPDLFPEAFGDAEELFRSTNSLIENGDVEQAQKNQSDLIQRYSDLEKNALEKGIIELAKMAFEQARFAEAEDYAPKYFNRAQKELNLALSIIETDRTQTEKANEHAKIASNWAKNASQISELIKMFKNRDFSDEDIITWYWQQLEIINEPLEDPIDFQQPNHNVIENLKKKIADLKQLYLTAHNDYKIAQDDIKKLSLKAELAEKKQKMELSEQQRIQTEKERMEWESKQKFAFIQAIFTPNEAQVYRKMDNVLISAHGFYFPSGKDEIQSVNFGLMNKILSAINQFPKANISISGHTDSVGTAELNLALSEKRAENVANFIMNMGRISADRITYKGYGDTKPIASNKTEEGRAQNRRIELMIINEE
jgi:outer membrane protein OmpA-like peptidoglycan-associated protein